MNSEEGFEEYWIAVHRTQNCREYEAHVNWSRYLLQNHPPALKFKIHYYYRFVFLAT